MTPTAWLILVTAGLCAAIAGRAVCVNLARRKAAAPVVQVVEVTCQWCDAAVPVPFTAYAAPRPRVVADRLSFADLHAHVWQHLEQERSA